MSAVITALNTTTGSLVAPTLTYTGEVVDLTFNPDHTRALLTYGDANTGSHAAIIDTTTATQTGPILKLPGTFTNTLLLTADSTHATILTTDTPPKGTPTTTLTTINLDTGTV